MIRFLQKPGPVKKYVLGGILVVVSLTMVTYLIPGGIQRFSWRNLVHARRSGESRRPGNHRP